MDYIAAKDIAQTGLQVYSAKRIKGAAKMKFYTKNAQNPADERFKRRKAPNTERKEFI